MNRTASISVIAAALISAASCSLKEDREPCPCWLDINLQECGTVLDNRNGQVQERPVREVSVAAWNDSFLFQQKVGHEDYGEPYEKAVPKSYVSTSVVTGEERMVRDGYRLTLREDEDADEIFAHAGHVACFREFASDTAVLHKQFARVKVKITNPVGKDYPYTFRLRGTTCGLDLRDLTPLDGNVGMDLTRGKDDIIEFNLIRQREDSLIEIDILEDGRTVETLPVHDWIARLGYSWLAKDLQDISINIDYAKGEISVSVSDWQDGGSVRIEI